MKKKKNECFIQGFDFEKSLELLTEHPICVHPVLDQAACFIEFY